MDYLQLLHKSTDKTYHHLELIQVDNQRAETRLKKKKTICHIVHSSKKGLKLALNDQKIASQAQEGKKEEASLAENHLESLQKALDGMHAIHESSIQYTKEKEEVLDHWNSILEVALHNEKASRVALRRLRLQTRGRFVYHTLFKTCKVRFILYIILL